MFLELFSGRIKKTMDFQIQRAGDQEIGISHKPAIFRAKLYK